MESTAGRCTTVFTLGLKLINQPKIQFDVNYTLSWDKSDDDNERDPFSFRYAQADRLDAEYNWSDRDQRHRLNAWLFWEIPWQIYPQQPGGLPVGPAGLGELRRQQPGNGVARLVSRSGSVRPAMASVRAS